MDLQHVQGIVSGRMEGGKGNGSLRFEHGLRVPVSIEYIQYGLLPCQSGATMNSS